MQNYLADLVRSQLKGEKPGNLPENLSVEEIIDIASRNHMDYLLLGALLKVDNIPEEKRDLLRVRVRTSIFKTIGQVEDLKQLVAAFEKAGIKNQPMKGACLKFMYPSPEMREMGDLDILIAEDRMEEAGKIMGEFGYSLSQSIKHHDIYFKKPFLIVELHRSMYDKTVDGNQYEYFKSFDKAILKEGKQYTYDFNKEDFYVYMIAHMAKHFYVMGCGPRNLIDVYIYLEKYGKELDRDYINKELEKCGILEFTEHIEKLAYIWLEGKESSKLYDDMFQYMLDSGIYGKDANGIWHKFADKKFNDKKITKFQLKKWYFFPPLSYMAEYYPWLENHHFLLPVAWFIRFCRGLFLKKGKKKREMLRIIDIEKAEVYRNIYSNMNLKFKH